MKNATLMLATLILGVVGIARADISVNPRGSSGGWRYYELYGNFAIQGATISPSAAAWDAITYTGGCALAVKLTHASPGQINIAIPDQSGCDSTQVIDNRYMYFMVNGTWLAGNLPTKMVPLPH